MNSKNAFIRVSAGIVIAFFSLAGSLFGQAYNDVLGKWQATDDPTKRIEFFKGDDGLIYGKSISDSDDKKMKAGQTVFKKCWFDEKNEILERGDVPARQRFSVGGNHLFGKKWRHQGRSAAVFLYPHLFFQQNSLNK